MAVVVLKRCGSYDPEEVARAVGEALADAIGGDTADLGGKRVLLKPNLAAARAPERCVTTHPAIVGAAIDYFVGRGCNVFVGDSPAGAVRGVDRVLHKTGMLKLCEDKGAQPVNFEAGGWLERSVEGRTYRLARAAFDFDRVINMPKLKTHILTLITGAIKNMFGCVPGFAKSAFHLHNPKPAAMSKVLVDVFSIANPWVSLVDAVEAMDGNGPSSGGIRHLGVVAASRDAVALDAVLSQLVGIDPMKVPTTREAARRGLGESDLGKIDVRGVGLADLQDRPFRVPSNWAFSLVPDVLARAAARWFWVKPHIDPSRCTGCGDCAGMCAASAMKLASGVAVLDRDRCVSCLCCIEACPCGAIEPRVRGLARLLT